MSHYQDSPTLRLFASTPSFVKGVGRILDFSQTLDQYNSSATAEEANARALKSDWEAVGRDIQFAIDKYAEQRNGR